MAKKRAAAVNNGAVIDPPASSPLPKSEFREIEVFTLAIDRVKLDHLNGRGRVNEASIEEMARSLASVGQLQPIGVQPIAGGAGGYELSWGLRRLLGAKRCGWTKINATEVHGDTEEAIVAARNTENVQRQDWNLIEEAAAVARLLDQMELRAVEALHPGSNLGPLELQANDYAKVHTRAVELTAERLGKSTTWVRDRAFLGRLDGKSRQLVIDGRLPLAHAREIAKLADPALRDEVAEWASSGRKLTYSGAAEFPESLRNVRYRVAKSLYSLAQVPWKLDRAFAGAPACVNCPHNSTNSAGLFEHSAQFSKGTRPGGGFGAKEPEAGVCTNAPCYKRKNQSANAAARSAAAKVAASVIETKGKSVNAAAAAKLTPAHVNPSAVTAIARQKIEEGPKAKKSKSSSGAKVQRSDPYNSPQAKAERDHAQAEDVWFMTHLRSAIEARAKKDSAFLGMLLCLEHHDVTNGYGDKLTKRLASPKGAELRKRLASPTMDDVEAVIKELDPKQMYLDGLSESAVMLWIAEAIGTDLSSRPKLEDFLPKPAAEQPEKSKPAKKPGRKKHGKKSST